MENTNPTPPPNQPPAGTPPPGSTPPPATAAGGDIPKDAKMFGMLCHISALVGFVIPFGNVIAPLILWLMKKNEFAFVDDQGKESLNFQITVAIAGVVCVILTFVLIGLPLLILLAIGWLILTIIAAIKANEGIAYRYPFALRLIK